MIISRKDISDISVDLDVELNAEELLEYVAAAKRHLASGLKIDGFRPGKIPPDVAAKHLNESEIREEALQRAVNGSLMKAFEKENLRVLSQESFKIIENTPEKLVYKMRVVLFPTVKLGEYKGLSIARKKVEVTEAEIDSAMEELARLRGEGNELGIDRESMREGILMEKNEHEHERIHIELLKQVVERSTVTIPDIMVERQLDGMVGDFERELSSRGMQLDAYLEEAKKKREDLRKDWSEQAKNQVKMSLVTEALAEAEHLKIEEEELENEVQLRIQQFIAARPESDIKALDKVNMDAVRGNLYSLMISKKVFEMLQEFSTIADAQ